MKKYQPLLIILVAISAMAGLLHLSEPDPIAISQTSDAESPEFSIASASTEDQTAFLAQAFGSVDSNDSQASSIRKWAKPLRIKVEGRPTKTDRATVEATIKQFNNYLRTSAIALEQVSVTAHPKANVAIRFIPESRFSVKEPNYSPKTYYTRFSANDAGEIQYASILISTTEISQAARSRLIQEQLIKALGFPSLRSQQSDSTIEQLIRQLYRADIQPGMKREAVKVVL